MDKVSKGSKSSKSKRSRYHTVAPNSHVDGKHAPTPPKKSAKRETGETIQVISSNLIRSVRIRRDPVKTGRLPSAEYKRICSASSSTRSIEANNALTDTPDTNLETAREMKEKIMTMDSSRPKRTPTKMEQEAKTQGQINMELSKASKLEQEDEVKMLNRVIAHVKCQAARDYQMQEKKQIQAELHEEDERLNRMMETNRVKFVETEAQIQELRKNKDMKHKQQILQDIQVRLEMKQLQSMTREQDRQHLQKLQETIRQENVEALEKKRKEQQRERMEIMEYSAERERARQKKIEEDTVTELRITSFNRYKNEREANLAVERRCSRLVREMATDRIGVLQQRANANKETQYQRFMRKMQENNDREWRKQQRELAERKAHAELVIRAARIEQIHCKELIRSAEAGRQKAEFDKILRAQQDAIIRQKQAEERRRKAASRTAEILQQQMKERKALAMARCRESMDRAKELAAAEQQRLTELREYRERKLQELRITGLPRRYLTEAELKTKSVTAPVKPVCRFPPKPSNVGLPPIYTGNTYGSRN